MFVCVCLFVCVCVFVPKAVPAAAAAAAEAPRVVYHPYLGFCSVKFIPVCGVTKSPMASDRAGSIYMYTQKIGKDTIGKECGSLFSLKCTKEAKIINNHQQYCSECEFLDKKGGYVVCVCLCVCMFVCMFVC